jgi:hypothetical protein
MLYQIRSARIVGNATIALTWDDGASTTADFSQLIEREGVFSQLRDPEAFASVTLDPSGRFLSWPGDIDVCADALRMADGIIT